MEAKNTFKGKRGKANKFGGGTGGVHNSKAYKQESVGANNSHVQHSDATPTSNHDPQNTNNSNCHSQERKNQPLNSSKLSHTSKNSRGSKHSKHSKTSNHGSTERSAKDHLAREIKQNFMTMLDQIEFEKKELDHKRAKKQDKKDDGGKNLSDRGDRRQGSYKRQGSDRGNQHNNSYEYRPRKESTEKEKKEATTVAGGKGAAEPRKDDVNEAKGKKKSQYIDRERDREWYGGGGHHQSHNQGYFHNYQPNYDHCGYDGQGAPRGQYQRGGGYDQSSHFGSKKQHQQYDYYQQYDGPGYYGDGVNSGYQGNFYGPGGFQNQCSGNIQKYDDNSYHGQRQGGGGSGDQEEKNEGTQISPSTQDKDSKQSRQFRDFGVDYTSQSMVPQIQYSQGKPIFAIDWDSESIESYESMETNNDFGVEFDRSNNFYDGAYGEINSARHTGVGGGGHMRSVSGVSNMSKYASSLNPTSQSKPIIVLQNRRDGFLQQYIYTEQQLEQMKLQQQQKEMRMKPWERDIQEMERFFVKTQEEENIKLNQSSSSPKGVKGSSKSKTNSSTTATWQASQASMVQQFKDRQKQQIISHYFNYGFNEESFKKYIKDQCAKYYDQQSQDINDQSAIQQHQMNFTGKLKVIMYEAYLEQQAQRHMYKQIREDLKFHQNIMQQQIQIQLQQQQQMQLQQQQIQQQQQQQKQQQHQQQQQQVGIGKQSQGYIQQQQQMSGYGGNPFQQAKFQPQPKQNQNHTLPPSQGQSQQQQQQLNMQSMTSPPQLSSPEQQQQLLMQQYLQHQTQVSTPTQQLNTPHLLRQAQQQPQYSLHPPRLSMNQSEHGPQLGSMMKQMGGNSPFGLQQLQQTQQLQQNYNPYNYTTGQASSAQQQQQQQVKPVGHQFTYQHQQMSHQAQNDHDIYDNQGCQQTTGSNQQQQQENVTNLNNMLQKKQSFGQSSLLAKPFVPQFK